MSRAKKPWWMITRTRRVSLMMSVVWTLVTASQVSNVITKDHRGWFDLLVVCSPVLTVYYLSAWWVRGRHEQRNPVS